jgi:glyoxylase-like metal-dependent hydrolase (beta-lactamase superfamily II)
MNKHHLFAIAGLFAFPALAALGLGFTFSNDALPGRLQTRNTDPFQPAHRFERIADDIYMAAATGAVNVGSNTVVIVNERDVMIVDSHITPASARALVEDIKSITDKPIRYVVNTHYHFDHAHGNQIFGPEVQVIGHEFTRAKLSGDVMSEKTYISFNGGIPAQLEQQRAQLAAETEPERRAQLESRLKYNEAHWAALQEVKPTPPNVTLRDRMTLYLGGREIQLIHPGRAHTGGDVIVYLPAERIICTGDAMTAGTAYMGDGFIDEWDETLETIVTLDFETVLPGHGAPFQGKERLGQFRDYLRELWKQAAALKAEGVSAADAAPRIDLSANPLARRGGAPEVAVARIYELIDSSADVRLP